jgi:hypothetical protein
MAVDRRDWSRAEVEAIVADYFDMLARELRGEVYSKTDHRRRLMAMLNGRTDGSIEYKHQNITAALNELGVPGIDGYKPAKNYQDLLLEVVRERLAGAEGLLLVVRDQVEKPAQVPTVDDILTRLVNPPPRDRENRYRIVRDRPEPAPVATNYLLREARNTSLGGAGEEFVLNFERARLLAGRQDRLAAKIEHVSRTRGDHEGFDVLSFETDSSERLIEVKTTAFGPLTPFFVSANQVRESQRRHERYHVYRVFRFRKDPHLFALRGAIDQNFELEAREFLARPA